MDREEIKQRLKALPPTAATAFVARVAMRWLPFLSKKPTGGTLARMGLKQQAVFDYWKEEERQPHLLAVLYAQAGAVGVALGSEIARAGEWRRRRAAAAAYAAAATTATDAYAAAAATTADAAYVADTAAAAAKRIASYFPYEDESVIWRQYEFDLHTLETDPIATLLHLPLWQAAPPAVWQQQWALFVRQVLQLAPSFAIWLQWLTARINCKPIDLPLLEQWLSVPPEITNQSPIAINQYLASLDHAKKALNRVRTIFIGYGEAGKTSLIRTLHNEPVVEGIELMTPGIEIREWDGAGDGLITHFWDFGGQVMAHATHQFFLRASCLYVLVLSARAEINATEQAEYWLQHVQAFGGNATVMIVGNKHDQTPVHIDMASLQAKYPNVLGFYPFSCTQAQGAYQHKFNDFQSEFCQQLNRLGTHQVMFTDAQFAVLSELRQRATSKSFLPHAEFDALCHQHKIGADGGQTKENFLDLLDKLGVIIHFKNLPTLSEYVLNPRWLTYGVYTVMYAQRARLSLAEIVALLSGAEVHDEHGQTLHYPPEKCNFIAIAMRYFKLCYHLPHDADRFIIPALLETDQPKGLQAAQFDKTQSLAYKIAFTGFVPRHVMSEFIVENNEAIENELVWQYGVLLKHRELAARAIAQVDFQARELSIWVVGRDAREYLGHLRDDLKRILSRLTMKYEELIRLPQSAMIGGQLPPQDDDWGSYAQIESYLRDGARSFISTRGFKYDLPILAGMYVKNGQKSTGGDTYYISGGDNKFNHTEGDMTGDKNFTMHGGTINGPVNLGDNATDSFNTTTNNSTNPELAKLLQQMLAEIQALNAKVPAAQVAAIDEDAQQLLTESQRAQPRTHWYQASVGGIVDAAQKLGEVGAPLLEVAQQVKSFLNL
jgi:hypothetical protein